MGLKKIIEAARGVVNASDLVHKTRDAELDKALAEIKKLRDELARANLDNYNRRIAKSQAHVLIVSGMSAGKIERAFADEVIAALDGEA